MNISCPICQEVFRSPDVIHVTPCGHLFHIVCLDRWLANSATCPSCRNRCARNKLIRLYANISSNDSIALDSSALQNETDNLRDIILKKDAELRANKNDITVKTALINNYETKLSFYKEAVKGFEEKYTRSQAFQKILRDEISTLKLQNKELVPIKKELVDAKSKLGLLENVQNIIESTTSEVDNLLKNHVDAKSLAIMVATLKRELRANENKKIDLRNTLRISQKETQKGHKLINELHSTISNLESDKAKLLDDLKALKEDKSLLSTKTHTENIEPTFQSVNVPQSNEFSNRSDSPYLNIRSSSISMAMLKNRNLAKRAHDKPSTTDSKTTNGVKPTNAADEYGIFKRPRIMRSQSNPMKSAKRIVLPAIDLTNQ